MPISAYDSRAKCRLGLKQDKMPADEIKVRVDELLNLFVCSLCETQTASVIRGSASVLLCRSLAKRPNCCYRMSQWVPDKQLRTQMQLEVDSGKGRRHLSYGNPRPRRGNDHG